MAPLPRKSKVKNVRVTRKGRVYKFFKVDDCGDGKFLYASKYSFQQGIHGFSCDLCGFVIKEMFYMKQHIRRTHFEEGREYIVTAPVESDNTGEPLVCQVCLQNFKNESRRSFAKHVLTHHTTNDHSPDLLPVIPCGDGRYLFDKIWIFRKTQSDDSVSSYSCDICPELKETQEEMIEHLKSVHNETSVCEQCGKKFATRQQLRTHQRRPDPNESQGMPLKILNCKCECTLCGTILKTFEIFKGHMKRVHASTKSFVCEFCGLAFVDNTALKSHLVVHKTETPFCCEVCGSAQKTLTRLKQHKEKHENIECENCQRKFTTHYNLQKHQVKHCSGIKGSKCPHCGQIFYRRLPLQRHIETAHPQFSIAEQSASSEEESE